VARPDEPEQTECAFCRASVSAHDAVRVRAGATICKACVWLCVADLGRPTPRDAQPTQCSFCGRGVSTREAILGFRVSICETCVRFCANVLARRGARPVVSPPPPPTPVARVRICSICRCGFPVGQVATVAACMRCAKGVAQFLLSAKADDVERAWGIIVSPKLNELRSSYVSSPPSDLAPHADLANAFLKMHLTADAAIEAAVVVACPTNPEVVACCLQALLPVEPGASLHALRIIVEEQSS
jgi:hypothetical protein